MIRSLTLTLLVITFAFTACGKDTAEKTPVNGGRALQKGEFPNVPQSVFGQWKSDQDEYDRGIRFQSNLYFNKDSFGVELTCSRGFDSVSVGVAVKANVSETRGSVEVLESAKASVKANGITCTVEITPRTFNYALNRNALTLFNPNSTKQNVTLTRIQ